MAQKPKRLELSEDHPLHEAGFVHELDVFEPFGMTWNTWVREYRTKIPGRTLPNGRWFHRDHLVAWWNVTVSATGDGDNQSSDS